MYKEDEIIKYLRKKQYDIKKSAILLYRFCKCGKICGSSHAIFQDSGKVIHAGILTWGK